LASSGGRWRLRQRQRRCTLDPAAQDSYVDRERKAKGLVAHLRFEAGRNAYDRNLSGLIGELSPRSPEFRTRAGVVQVTGYLVAGGILRT
jgi:hypothetical protein